MQPRWVRWTVIAVVVLVVLALALTAVPSFARAAVVAPPVNASADYQLGGAYQPAAGVRVVTRDRTERPSGRYDICYVNAFQTQPDELGWWQRYHPSLLLRSAGRLVRDPGWPDEVLLDTRTVASRGHVGAVLDAWVGRCARAGYDAVEPDNLDSWTRAHGLLSAAGNLALARLVVASGHRHGLAVAQKNVAELSRTQARRAAFDFAVAEDCQVYAECAAYRRLYGDRVVEIEYADEGRAGFDRACVARGARWSIVYRDRDLRRPGQRGYVRDAC